MPIAPITRAGVFLELPAPVPAPRLQRDDRSGLRLDAGAQAHRPTMPRMAPPIQPHRYAAIPGAAPLRARHVTGGVLGAPLAIDPVADPAHTPGREHSITTLVLSCSGPGATALVHDFMAARGQTGRYDLLSLVGGAGGASRPDWLQTFMEHLETAIELHGIDEVVIAGHTPCSPFARGPSDASPAEDPLAAQVRSMAALESHIRRAIPVLQITPVLLEPAADLAPTPPHVLLLSCMDFRLIEPTRQHMQAQGLDGQYSHLVLAGASLGALADVHFPAWGTVFMEQLADEVRHNGTRKIILLDHRDCGAYRLLLNAGYGMDADAETRLHAEQLQRLAAWIAALFPGIEMELQLMALDGSVATVRLVE